MLTLEVAPTDPLTSIVQYGVLGIVLMLLLTGYLWPKPAVDELKAQHAREHAAWIDKALPDIEAASRDTAEILKVVKENSNELAEVTRLLENRRGP